MDSEITNMHKIIKLTSSLSKPLKYGEAKNVFMQPSANITQLQLNTHPIPKQPVPNLKKTAEKYLRTLEPILNANQYESTKNIVHEFIKEEGIGTKLYQKLLKRFDEKENWMSEWWLKAAYLGYRLPVIVHSSPGIVGPFQRFNKPEDLFKFAARLICAVCNYDKMIKSGKVEQEMIRDIPLDMQPYGLILGTHRKPNPEFDLLLHTDFSNHIIVINNNKIFKLSLNDIDESKLAASIKDIVERAQNPGKAVGILTGNDRDSWAQDYQILESLGNNKNILREIETSLFVLCIDNKLPTEVFKNKNFESVRAIQSLTGHVSNTGNRWHDKTVQFIVSFDGFFGMEYEHSPCEGGPVAVLHDFVLNYCNSKRDNFDMHWPKNFTKAELLDFDTDQSIENSIKKARDTVHKLIQNIDLECFMFSDFGANAIKNCKLSPDSFIQVAMQITYYKIHKEPPVHYESAALRRFRNARTECIRSTCNETVHCAKLLDTNSTLESRKQALINAVDAHKNIAGEAATGEGVDRLFFGLKMIAKEEKIELPLFFNDIGYTKSNHFTLTSSQVPFKSASFMCYGPVVTNGYGCCYNPRGDDILFACSSFNECSLTDTKHFAETLKHSLRMMRDIVKS